MRVFSTFSGIGGFEIGIQNAYRSAFGRFTENQTREHQEWERLLSETGKDISPEKRFSGQCTTDFINQGPSCVGYSEIDKYAVSVYERHFKGVKNYGDITKINADKLPDFDCLVGGFPCQAFSIAGKRGGFEDTRGTLFFDLARILRAKQPRLFVFENVKGLLSHDNGNTFKTIIATINELGYDCQWQVLNSKNHGVPQNRERVYIVGHLRGTTRPQVFPIDGANSQDIVQVNRPTHSNDRVYASEGVSPTLNTMQGGNRQPFVSEPPKIRRLTPVECERLQGFPDNWTKYGEDEHGVRVDISDTQRYKMCGNAVTTNVVQAVFERIFNGISG